MSRDNYYRSANFLSDSDAGTAKDADEDELLPGDYGGRGIGLAGGYPPPSRARALLAGAGDDVYAGYDPGMAGCTCEPISCPIPGMPHMGSEHSHRHRHHSSSLPISPNPSVARLFARPGAAPKTGTPVYISRGYERDGDEYMTLPPPSSSSSPSSSSTPPTPTGAGSERATVDETDQYGDVDPERPFTKPPIGTRIVGRVERLAGKVFRDPEIEARGMRHMTGQDSLTPTGSSTTRV